VGDADIREFSGDAGELYALWLATAAERPWETRKTLGQFKGKYIDDPFQRKGFVLTICDEGEVVAAALMSLISEMERAVVRIWVLPERQRNGFGTILLKESISRLKKQGKWRLECEPVPFCPGYNAFFKAKGFRPDKDYPGGYLMRRLVNAIPPIAAPKSSEIVRVCRIDESNYFDRVANVEIGYAKGNGQKIDLAERKSEMLAAMADAKAQCYSLAVDGERVLGFSRSAIVENVAGELQLRNRGLIVSSEARGSGIGRALLDDNLAWGYKEGARVAYISTHSANPAKRLYERAGYEVVETVENLTYNADERTAPHL
jgi:GNAT superfamily N-acetyltransferase